MSHTLIESELPLLARLGAGVIVIDPVGRVARWSETAARIFGVAVEDAVGRPWSECVTLIRGDEAGATLRVEIGQQGGWHGPIQVRTRAGQIIGLRAHLQQVVMPEFGDELCSVALFWEGQGPDLAVSGPEAAQLPYRELFRSSSECLFLIDLEGCILDVTAASAALLDVKPADLLGRDIVEFVAGGNELAEAARSELITAGSIHRLIRVSRPDGTTFPAEAFISLASPDPAGLAFVRVRDTSNEERQQLVAGELAVLARPAEPLLEVEDVVRRAIDIAGSVWGSIAALALLDGVSEGVVAGSNASEVIRATLMDIGKDSPLVRTIRDSDEPLRLDLHGSHQWDKRARNIGLATLWAMPLTFDSNRIGTMVLFWGDKPPASLDVVQAAHAGRQVGAAISGATTRATLRRETLMRESLATPARVGSVVLEQMTDSILTTDAAGLITAINSAGERLYGLARDETVGRALSEVIEQLGLGGSPLDAQTGVETSPMGYWQGRVVHRPLVGSRAGQQIVVDLSQTTIRDDRHRPAGLILMSREVTASARLETEAAALSSLAVATERARSRHEVAEVALERLCEATLADAAIIATWEGQPGETPVIEATRGLGQDFIDLIRPTEDPRLGSIFDVPGAIMPFDEAMQQLAGTDLHRAATHEGLASGFVVGLRLRDRAVGFLGLASRSPYWIRPSDAVILQAGAQIMGALENARLMERLEQGLAQERRLTAQLEGLIGLTQLPAGDVNESTIAQFLLSRITATLGARSGFLVRLARHDRFRVVASLGLGNEMTHMLGELPVDKVAFWQRLVATGGHSAFLERVTEDAENPGLKRMLDAGLTSYAVFPVLEADAVAGAFVCQFAAQSEAGLTANERTIDALGRIISIAYANVRMTEGLNEAAEHERRLTAELRALQELTLMGATDDLDRLAQETTEAVVVSTGAAGGGYILIDPESGALKPVLWVGQASDDWDSLVETGSMPADLPSQEHFMVNPEVWLSRATTSPAAGGAPSGARAVLPLWVDGKLAGMLNLEWSTSPRVQQFDDHFLEPIARICSISLANFRLRAETLHREATQKALGHRLDTLDELTRIGEEASSFDELAHRTVSLVREALGATGVCYLLIEPGNHFDTKAVAGDIGAFRHWLNGVPAKDAPGGPILLSGSNSCLSDFSVGRVNERVLPLARAASFRSFGAIPIRTGEELAGALLCFFEQPVEALPIDETALDSVARIGGIALANYHLRARLVTSEERYRTLFEESPDALFVTALDGTVLDANDAAVRLYRVNRGEVLGRYLGQFIVADEREMARRRQIVWAHGRGTFTDRGRRADGSEFQVEIEVRVVELGGQRRFLTLVRDLSDQERLMGELAQAQKMEAIGHLVSGVAHELNNPLAAIIAFSQLIRTDQRLPDDMKHDAGLLVQEADRTRRIVQGLLDFARQRPPDRSRASISALIKSVLELQSYALSANNVEVVMDIPSELPEVDLDRAQMQQVLLNLTINAIQAIRAQRRSSPGLGRAHLWIGAVSVEAPRGSGGAGTDGQRHEARIRITVRDDGPGVPESARARLFDPFFTTKQPGEGTGLGLSVSFGIVAAHGGHLWYEPGPGNVGSSFMVELPVHARPSAEENPAAIETPAEQGQPTAAEPAGRRTARGRGAREAAPAPETSGAGPASGADGSAATRAGGAAGGGRGGARREARAGTASRGPTAGATDSGGARAESGITEESDNSGAGSMISEGAGSVTEAPKPARPRILALDDEFAIRAFLTKVLDKSGMDCDSYQDGAQALAGLAAHHYDAMLIDHRMAGMSGTDFYEAATESQPRLAKRAIFMSGDVLNPDLKGFATQRGVRLLAKPFDIDAVIRVVREAISDAEAAEAR